MIYTSIPKPVGPTYTMQNVLPIYDDPNLTYDDLNTFYDGANQALYTNVAKPTGPSYTSVAKPT